MNIAEIAELAGVSRAAVSRYFNNGYISEEKRQAIRRVVEETGYRPSVQAQTLRTRKTKMVGVIVPKVASSAIGKLVDGFLSVLDETEFRLLLAVTQSEPQKELDYLSAFHEKQVDGVIFAATVLTPEHKRELKNIDVPVVIAGQKLKGYCCVYHDDYHAAYDLTRFFWEKGRKKLGYISARMQDKAAGEERCRGFQDAVQDFGCRELAENVVIADFSFDSGREKAGELLEKCGNLDGIICATDTMAAGAMQYLCQHKIKVPDQMLVAGHGGSELAKVTMPPLVTVQYFYEKSGEIAARMLLDLMEKREAALQEVKLGYRIVDGFGEEWSA